MVNPNLGRRLKERLLKALGEGKIWKNRAFEKGAKVIYS